MLPFATPPPSPPWSPLLFEAPSSPTVEPPSSSTKRKEDTPSSSSKKMQKKNSPRNTDPPHMWPDAVFEMFAERLATNRSSKGEAYFIEKSAFEADIADVPPALQHERCHNPVGCNFITLCYEKQEYKRPLHRIRFLLKIKNTNGVVPTKENQASHLCMDSENTDGKGAKHCCNPDHLVDEDDATNKLRQRCAGWIWIHPIPGITEGGFWYPSCTHQPACLRFTPKSCVPTLLK